MEFTNIEDALGVIISQVVMATWMQAIRWAHENPEAPFNSEISYQAASDWLTSENGMRAVVTEETIGEMLSDANSM